MHLSISQLSELTGRDRRTVAKQLSDLKHTPGERGATLYESTQALPLVYAVDNLEAARAAQVRTQASLNAVREEDLRKQRIPIQIMPDVSTGGKVRGADSNSSFDRSPAGHIRLVIHPVKRLHKQPWVLVREYFCSVRQVNWVTCESVQ